VLLDAKHAALAALESAARTEQTGSALDDNMRPVALRLRDAAAENKRLLE
jgi:hypothetical protein